MTQKQLVENLKKLKEIKPNQEWASLLKSQILVEKQPELKIQKAKTVGIAETLSFLFASKKLAYSFAVLLIMFLGVYGFFSMGTKISPRQQTASLTMQSEEEIKVIVAINDKIKNLTQELKKNPAQDPQTIKNIVASLKTLANVPGTESTSTIAADLQDLYGVIAVNQIIDLQKTTLTDDQKKIIKEAMELYNNGEYGESLEKVLLINK